MKLENSIHSYLMAQKTGEVGEEEAVKLLSRLGYKILRRNYRTEIGELDIVAEKNHVLHFIEVKASKYYPDSGFLPEIRVNSRKMRKLRRISEIFLNNTPIPANGNWQIDIISVVLNKDLSLRKIEVFENAVMALC